MEYALFIIAVAILVYLGVLAKVRKDPTIESRCRSQHFAFMQAIDHCPTTTQLAFLDNQVNEFYYHYLGRINNRLLLTLSSELYAKIANRRTRLVASENFSTV